MAKRVSLPPGVYKISDTNFLTDPGGDKKTLTVSAEDTVDTARQQWLVSANGVIRSLDYGNKFTHLSQDKVKKPPIISSGTPSEWMIKVKDSVTVGKYTGTIWTNDGTKRFWQVTDTEVLLVTVGTATEWTFLEVA